MVFARRLVNLRVAKGWNQSELARQAGLYMPSKKFNRDNVSKYEKGTVLPLPLQLNALAKALGTKPEELLPEASHGLTSVMEENPQMALQSAEGGKAWIRINQKVDMDDALKILAILRKQTDAHT